MRSTWVFAFGLFLVLFVHSEVLADTRVALVIGNGAYQNAPHLPNPINDATDVAAALKRDGFDTILATDLGKAAMDEVSIRFAKAARTADVAIFYYSGHAIQFAGVNYLAPVDINLTDEADLRRMVRVDDVVADLQQAKNLRILVLDSCRDNPLADQLKRSIGASRALPLQRGLAKIDSPLGMIVSYATQSGRTAEDGSGRNSPYTAAFLKNIEAREEIGTIFRRVSADVYETTGHTQLPELSLSLIGEFYLHGRSDISVDGGRVPGAYTEDAAAVWAATKDTTSIAALQELDRRFPNTVYQELARARIRELQMASRSPAAEDTNLSPAPSLSRKISFAVDVKEDTDHTSQALGLAPTTKHESTDKSYNTDAGPNFELTGNGVRVLTEKGKYSIDCGKGTFAQQYFAFDSGKGGFTERCKVSQGSDGYTVEFIQKNGGDKTYMQWSYSARFTASGTDCRLLTYAKEYIYHMANENPKFLQHIVTKDSLAKGSCRFLPS